MLIDGSRPGRGMNGTLQMIRAAQAESPAKAFRAAQDYEEVGFSAVPWGRIRGQSPLIALFKSCPNRSRWL